MFKRLLPRKAKSKKAPSALSALDKLRENLAILEKKENLLQKRILAEVEKAKNYTKLKNKNAALQCLKKKKLYEAQIEQLGNFQLRVHDQIIMLEGAKATTDTMDALRTGASTMKTIQMSLNIDDIDNAMEDVTASVESMKQIQDALAAPVGAAADFDEDELEAELEELEELEQAEQLLQPPQHTPVIRNVPTGAVPVRTRQQPNNNVEELAALQAEMAI